MCSNHELKKMISANTQMLTDHIRDTQSRIDAIEYRHESLYDVFTRVSDAIEETAIELKNHVKNEDDYRTRDEENHIKLNQSISGLKQSIDQLNEDNIELKKGNTVIRRYQQRIDNAGWLAELIKKIALGIIAIGGAATVFYQAVKHFLKGV